MVLYERLLAKSGDNRGRLTRPQTLWEHTVEVIKAAERLLAVTGPAQLRALGLEPGLWIDRFHREIRVAALLHDLGKANDHFQAMIRAAIRRQRSQPQGIRHEAVSFLITRLPEVQEWIRPAVLDPRAAVLVFWAIAGHHRKFPPADPPEGAGPEMRVFLSHADFDEVLARGAKQLDLGTPPKFSSDRTLRLTRLNSVLREFEDAEQEAMSLMESLSAEERRFLAALKACLICADVAGSIGRQGSQAMTEWIPDAFARVPTVGQLEGIVSKRLKGQPLRQFQREIAERPERVVFARGGCGSGKTLAAYHWAARRAPNRRLFFCYPTMGTATEGYRDYLVDPTLDADLVHGRAEVDMEVLGLGDDEPGPAAQKLAENRLGRAAADSAGALDQWSTPLVSCTVDTVLGLTQNNRRGIYAWPSIAGAACIFDEIHSYDDQLFAALLRFLAEVRGVPCVLMTASLPESRRQKILSTLAGIGETLGEVDGPKDLERLKRYQRVHCESPWELVQETIPRSGKVLWVVNTVDAALKLASDPRAAVLGALLYHSRFRYRDRVKRHKQVIDAFQADGRGAFAITSQVAEMSLDLSADLLVTQLAPISALIQRLGRLHRRAELESPLRTRPFIVLEPGNHLPYTEDQLNEARQWLKRLGDKALSQADLAEQWLQTQHPGVEPRNQSIWFDGGFVTIPQPLREASPGIEIIREADRDVVASRRCRPEEVRIPMPVPPYPDWRSWPEIAFCKVPPEELLVYDEERGAAWKR